MSTSRPRWDQAAKQIMSTHLLNSWRMFFHTGHLAHALPPGTPGDVRGIYGATMGVHLRRLVSFYLPPPKPRADDVDARRYVPNWDAITKHVPLAPFEELRHYIGKYVAHLTEAMIDCPVHLPVPEGGKIISALAPVHNVWLRAVVKGDPADLDVSWARNTVCFEIASNPAAEQEDGLSKYQTDNMVFRFYSIAGEPVSTPPQFLADLVLPRAT